MRRNLDEMNLDAALARYSRLPYKHQYRIVQELLRTRSHELRHAYAGVVRIGLGVRRRRDEGRTYRTYSEEALCVVFMVSRKWRRTRKSGDGCIPRHLLTYSVDARGTPKLFAIPTDVDAAQDLRLARAQSAISAKTEDSLKGGCVSCAIRQSQPSVRHFGVSCQHVLSLGTKADTSADEVLDEHGQRLGAITEIKGTTDATRVMDAQLFDITPPVSRKVFPFLEGFIRESKFVPETMRLVTRTSGPDGYSASILRHWAPGPDEKANNWMFAGELIAVEITGAMTQDGDSGSPLIAGKAHPLLVGMHIGMTPKEGGCISYSVPAWRLLNPRNYHGADPSPTWKLA